MRRLLRSCRPLLIFWLLWAPLPSHGWTGPEPVGYEWQADFILVEKKRHSLTLYRSGYPIKTYRIALGKGGTAPKRYEGDERTPEGIYYINGRNPRSDFHLSLRISYPAETDVVAASALGRDPGGDIMIHGIGQSGYDILGPLHVYKDWTAGCIAVTDEEIEEIWSMVPDGTTIEIRP